MSPIPQIQDPPAFELLFVALHRGANFAFPCDAAGTVDMNDLSVCAKHNYLLARTLVGRDFATPRVIHAHVAPAGLASESAVI